jgi:hypothetical protein
MINQDKIKDFVKSVRLEELDNADIKGDKSLSDEMSSEDHVAYSVIIGTMQFCFWGDPKWTITIDENNYDGGEALIRSIKRGIKEGYKILNPLYLSNISETDLKEIFRGTPEIPFLKNRLEMLRDLGKMVIEKYSGLFGNIVLNSDCDVNKIVENLVRDLPSVFDDTENYHGHQVHLYKRVQIISSYLFELSRKGTIPYKIFGKEGLTGLADYRAPQILRSLGIISYDKELEVLVDSKTEIPAGSDEEIEIRAFTLKAENMIADVLKERIPEINDALVHRILWFRCQKITIDKPYHRTRTVWY